MCLAADNRYGQTSREMQSHGTQGDPELKRQETTVDLDSTLRSLLVFFTAESRPSIRYGQFGSFAADVGMIIGGRRHSMLTDNADLVAGHVVTW